MTRVAQFVVTLLAALAVAASSIAGGIYLLSTNVDSEETEGTSSSVENVKKKKLFISKYKNGNIKKKKCKVHSKSEPDDSDCRSRSRSSQRISMHKLKGILKHTERESSEEDKDSEPNPIFRSQDRCFVGRVPRPAGAKPGRGGGVAIFFRKNGTNLPVKPSTTSTKRRRSTKRLARKRSY